MANVLVGLTAVSILALSAFTVWRVDVPVRHIRVDGALEPAEQAQVRAAVTPSIDGGFLSLDLDKVRTDIHALTWPQLVTVRRVWPDAIAIHVDKATVVAAWRQGYLTSDGRVVELPEARPDLPVLDCHQSDPESAMSFFHRLTGETGRDGLEIARLEENALGEWTIEFREGVTLNLGAERTGERLRNFLTVYRQRLAEQFESVSHVDARYANGVAVRWQADGLAGLDSLASGIPSTGNSLRVNDGI